MKPLVTHLKSGTTSGGRPFGIWFYDDPYYNLESLAPVRSYRFVLAMYPEDHRISRNSEPKLVEDFSFIATLSLGSYMDGHDPYLDAIIAEYGQEEYDIAFERYKKKIERCAPEPLLFPWDSPYSSGEFLRALPLGFPAYNKDMLLTRDGGLGVCATTGRTFGLYGVRIQCESDMYFFKEFSGYNESMAELRELRLRVPLRQRTDLIERGYKVVI